MYDGIINVYKERGWTSHDVVAKLRGICGQKKAGHTGTLDPDAEGVLVVCLGNATKASALLTDKEKEYRATLLLGVDTDTQDLSGNVLRKAPVEGITETTVRETLDRFVGEIKQIPPMYSARKVDGQRLYDLARKGETVERKPTLVTIREITVDEIDLPRVKFTVRCSKGTYIRTLCHDIGASLGCFGAMEYLLRTKSGGFSLDDALRIDEIQRLRDEERLSDCIHPVGEVFSDCPAVRTKERADRLLYNGNRIGAGCLLSDMPHAARIRMLDSKGNFCGIYRCDEAAGECVPVKMFLPEEQSCRVKERL